MKSKEELVAQFEKFWYIDLLTMMPFEDRIKEIEATSDREIQKQMVAGLIWEELEMLKLKTIEIYNGKKEGFQKDHYKRLVTLETIARDEMNIIPNMGIYMTPEEFNMYEQVYHELYEQVPIEEEIINQQ